MCIVNLGETQVFSERGLKLSISCKIFNVHGFLFISGHFLASLRYTWFLRESKR